MKRVKLWSVLALMVGSFVDYGCNLPPTHVGQYELDKRAGLYLRDELKYAKKDLDRRVIVAFENANVNGDWTIDYHEAKAAVKTLKPYFNQFIEGLGEIKVERDPSKDLAGKVKIK